MTTLTRRALLQSMAAAPLAAVHPPSPLRGFGETGWSGVQSTQNPDVGYGATTIPIGIRSRLVTGVNGITMHALEAGFETANRPAVLLIHGFPELGYSWRHVMLPLAKAGYHVIAPDQRGYGRSGGTDVTFDQDLAPFSTLNRVRDMMALINALGHRSVAMVVGHDFGSPVAGWCALTRPDVFRSVVMMSAPFGAPGPLPFNTASAFARESLSELRRDGLAPQVAASPNLDEELAKLPQPRKHYQTYYTTREANENMWHPPQGIHNFLRAYYHAKSADWAANKPFPLASNSATEMAKLPKYYVMDLGKGMAEQVAIDMPTAAGDRQLQVAHRRGAEGLRVRVWPHRFPGRAAVVSRRPRAAPVRGNAVIRGPHHRRAVAVRVGQE